MQDRIEPGRDHGSQRRGLGEAVHRGAQPVPAQDQDHREQAGGVGDADPPDVVDQVEAPDMRDVGAPHPGAPPQQHRARDAEQRDTARGRQQGQPPDQPEARQRHARDRPRVRDAAMRLRVPRFGRPAASVPGHDECAGHSAGCQGGRQAAPQRGQDAGAAHPDAASPRAATRAR
jgi:hypothetical protein